MVNSKNIGKVIIYLKRNYPETDYDDVKYLGIEGSPQNYILYYEKVQRYGMCFHCAYSEECAEYGDQTAATKEAIISQTRDGVGNLAVFASCN